jgi:hypothetical protein
MADYDYIPEDESEENFHARVLKNHQEARSADEEQRRLCLDDIKFALIEDQQWEEWSRRQRGERPRYTINRIKSSVQQVIGDMKQNRIGIKTRPRSGDASVDMAETLNGLIRSIENDSNFDYVGDVAAKEAFCGGFGAWQVITDYQDEESFDNTQDVKIKAIHSAASSVWFDPASTDEHHRDAMWCFVEEEISKAEHKERWPDAAINSLDRFYGWYGDYYQERDTIRIADYWCKKPYKKRIAKFSDGSIKEITKEVEQVLDEMAEQGLFIEEEKEIDSFKVVYYKVNGTDILEGPKDWAGSEIPVIPVYGSQLWQEGQHFYSGLVRFSKDAQRIYNYAVSSKVEETAVSLGNKLMATPMQMQGYEEFFTDSNPTKPIVYNPDARVPGGAPIRLGGTAVNGALIEQIQQADQDIQATLGIYQQSLGSNPREQSGRALLAQHQKMQTGSFEMSDNFARSKVRTGEILIDIIPELYDTERTIRVITDEGETKIVELNKTIVDDETGDEIIVENDITLGKYDVISSIGPSYQTQRQETQEKMAFIVQTAPELAPYALPVMLENDTSPAAIAMGKALKMDLVRAGKMEPNEEEKKKLAAEQAAKEQAGPTPQEIAGQLELERLKNENLKLAAEARKAGVEAYKEEMALRTQPQQEILENGKLASEIEKNQAQSAKLQRDADEPYQKRSESQSSK